jgi:hypothetical protein
MNIEDILPFMNPLQKELTEQRKKLIHPVLDPVARISEILFGLIMVLTFTCSLSAGESGHQEVRTMLLGAIGCNLAWGFVDAIMYLMSNVTEKARGIRILNSVRNTDDTEEAHRIIGDALPPIVTSVLKPEELESLRKKLQQLPEPKRAFFKREDWLGAIGVFFLVFLSTFPVIIPFLFVQDPFAALRLSNAVAIVMLFLTGYSLGRYAGENPWKTGLWMVIVGIFLVAITMALGG